MNEDQIRTVLWQCSPRCETAELPQAMHDNPIETVGICAKPRNQLAIEAVFEAHGTERRYFNLRLFQKCRSGRIEGDDFVDASSGSKPDECQDRGSRATGLWIQSSDDVQDSHCVKATT